MRTVLINKILEVSRRHESAIDAIKLTLERNISFLHVAHRFTGDQYLVPFRTWAEFREVDNDPYFRKIVISLGCYTVEAAVWDLAQQADVSEQRLAGNTLHRVEGPSFTEQLMARLIMVSVALSNPFAEMPEGYVMWRLCLDGDHQVVFVPSSVVEGSLPMLPDRVLADLAAPYDKLSLITQMISLEREFENSLNAARKELQASIGSLIAQIFQGGDFGQGFGHHFGNN